MRLRSKKQTLATVVFIYNDLSDVPPDEAMQDLFAELRSEGFDWAGYGGTSLDPNVVQPDWIEVLVDISKGCGHADS